MHVLLKSQILSRSKCTSGSGYPLDYGIVCKVLIHDYFFGYLQQNAYHKEDANVSLKKQYNMLKVIDLLYEKGLAAVKKGVPIGRIKDEKLFYDIVSMKYNTPEDHPEVFDKYMQQINSYFDSLISQYEKGRDNK
jgi:V/A-type H+-transporting ATPase subunit A